MTAALLHTTKMALKECCTCGIAYAITESRDSWLREHPGETFWCPNGHPITYVGKTEADKLREELERETARKWEALERLNQRTSHESTK